MIVSFPCYTHLLFGMEQDLTQFADKILSDDSTGCDGVDNYFATEADMLYEYDLDED